MKLDCKLLQVLPVRNALLNKNIRFDIGCPKYKIIYGTITNGIVNEIHNQLVRETSNGIKIQHETI